MDTSQYVTRQELESILDDRFEKFYVRIEKMVHQVVGEVVGEIVGNALQLISERFDKLEARMDRAEVRLDHIEDKLDRTIANTELQNVDIRALKRKIA